MKTLKTLLPLACLLLLPLTVFAAPIAYPFRVTDNSGALVAGATVAIGATALTSGSATTVPAAAGEKLLSTNAAPAATVSVTLLDYGTGDYALVYDPTVNGELYVPLTVSKAGSTITGGAALIALVAAADSSTIVGVNATTTSTNTLATGINTKTSLIATNAADSPNAAAAQGNASTLLLSLATYQSVLTAGSTSSALSTALVGTADLTGSKVVFTTGVNKGVTRTITSMNSGTGAINLLTATPSTPGATDAFSVVQGSKTLEQFLAALGTDSKPFLTATDTQAQAEVVAALVAQGYTVTRSAKLDNADVATSSRMATFVYTAPPTLPGDYLNAGEVAKLAFLDSAISSRSTYAGGAVASVTGAVGSVTASVVASNLPTDYQQRAVAVTLPTTAPAGYGGSTGDTPGTTTLLAKIGTPAGASLAADVAAVKSDTGNLVTSVAGLPTAVWTYTASDGLTHQQSDALRTSILARGFSVSYNAGTRTQVTTYFKADGVTVLATTTVLYDTTGRAVTRTTAFTNLP